MKNGEWALKTKKINQLEETILEGSQIPCTVCKDSIGNENEIIRLNNIRTCSKMQSSRLFKTFSCLMCICKWICYRHCRSTI